MEIEKGSKKTTMIIIILLILVIGLSGYTIYDQFLSKEEDTTVEKSSVNKNNTKNESESAKINNYEALLIDNSNCLTDCNNIEYTLGSSIAGDGIEVWFTNSKVNVNINRNLLKNEYAYQFISNEDTYTFDFTKKIQDVFIGHIGQDVSIPMLFILLEDGSVQYIDLYSRITTGDSTAIELSNVKNVIKFYSARVHDKGTELSGIITVLAQTSNGSFYDLRSIIFKQ